jgi:carbon monoxide dehydrogenase subunit G
VQLTGTVDIAAPRQAVWDLLMNVEALASCGPGVEAVARHDATHATVRAKVGVAFFSVGVTIDLELVEIHPPDSAVVRGRGEASGNQVEASGRLELAGPPAGPTTLAWVVDLDLPGSLAGLGPMIEGPARRMIDETVECLRAKVEAG